MYRANKNEKDVKYILDHLRKEDLNELKALYGDDYKQRVLDNVMKTDFYVLLGKSKDKNIPIVMGGIWGVSKEDEGIGGAWLLCTDKVYKHQICLLRELKKELQKADEKFWLTYNVIYKDNIQAKKWLEWLGFKFDKPKLKGVKIPEGFEFFYRIRPIQGLGG